jgi:hypothetical protein
MDEQGSKAKLRDALKKALADLLRRREVLLKRLRYRPEKAYMRRRPIKT